MLESQPARLATVPLRSQALRGWPRVGSMPITPPLPGTEHAKIDCPRLVCQHVGHVCVLWCRTAVRPTIAPSILKACNFDAIPHKTGLGDIRVEPDEKKRRAHTISLCPDLSGGKVYLSPMERYRHQSLLCKRGRQIVCTASHAVYNSNSVTITPMHGR